MSVYSERVQEPGTSNTETIEAHAGRFRQKMKELRASIGKVVVGQEQVVEGVLATILAGSHVLLEGVPGLGKTLLVKTLAQALGLSFSRIQFTPDLMPADVVGTTVLEQSPGKEGALSFQPGPLFAHIVLADEINRATPKTQSALLEAMQEGSVTVGRQTHRLEAPHLVLATQNPLEMEGTYPLPEAQLDRFFFKLRVDYPSRENLHEILDRTTAGLHSEASPVLSRSELLEFQRLVRQVPVPRHVQDYAVRFVLATHPNGESPVPEIEQFVREGASPRGAQAVLLAAKIRALSSGRYSVGLEDIREVVPPALRHRLLLNFEGEAEGITPDQLLKKLTQALPET